MHLINFFLKKSDPFREIIPSITPESKFKEILVRSLIRYSVRFFGFYSSYFFLSKILGTFAQDTYSKAVLNINLFSIKSYIKMLEGDLEGYLNCKRMWIDYIDKNPFNLDDKKVAHYYKSLLDFNNLNQISFTDKSDNSARGNYFLYGPNCDIDPPKNLVNCSLILTKFPLFKLESLNPPMLFLNSHTSNQFDDGQLMDLSKQYRLILKNNRNIDGINKIVTNPESELASSMGLNRILRHLLLTKKNRFSIEIVGFDLYSKESSYSNKILSAISKLDDKKKNFKILTSLWKHDLIFNFLELKDLCSQIEIINSDDFKKVMSLSLLQYWRAVLDSKT
jgi:hypothetical protein